eukprot:scaffold740_cov405-Prasinococcus_capsulatus_cf.AAC.7
MQYSLVDTQQPYSGHGRSSRLRAAVSRQVGDALPISTSQRSEGVVGQIQVLGWCDGLLLRNWLDKHHGRTASEDYVLIPRPAGASQHSLSPEVNAQGLPQDSATTESEAQSIQHIVGKMIIQEPSGHLQGAQSVTIPSNLLCYHARW